MKDQFRIAVIAVIVIFAVGLAVTGLTRSYIVQNESKRTDQSFKEGAVFSVNPEDEGEKLPQNAAQNAAKEEVEKQTESASEAEISIDIVKSDEWESYHIRLQELDATLEDAGSDSVETASAAYRAWDQELNAIYQMIRQDMTEEEFIVLRDEERAWLKERDIAADQASAGYSEEEGEIQYLISLTETTKERTYELVEMYFTRQ